MSKLGVFYIDGSFRPLTNAGGFGIHGYEYIEEVPKKGTGNAKATPTKEGYQGKANGHPLVTVVSYIDGFGSFSKCSTNIVAEVKAFLKLLIYIVQEKYTEVKVYGDNDHVVQGVTTQMFAWKKRGWKTATGDTIANKELWMEIERRLSEAKANGLNLTIEWVGRNDGIFGNEIADRVANKGSVAGAKGKDLEQFESYPPERYWKLDKEPSSLVKHKRCYLFSNDEEYLIDGEYTYWFGNVKEDEDHGKRANDTYNAVVQLKEPEPAIEAIRTILLDSDKEGNGVVLAVKSDELFKPEIYNELLVSGDLFIEKFRHKVDLSLYGKYPLATEINPPGKVYAAIENLNYLDFILRRHRNKTETYVETDLTPILFDDHEKKGRSLKKEWGVAIKHANLMINYDLGEGIKTVKLKAIFDHDLPKRNILNALSKSVLSTKIITFKDSGKFIKYMFIMETTEGWLISAPTDGNVLLVK